MKEAPQIIEESPLLQKAFNDMAEIGERYFYDPTVLRDIAQLQFRSCELIENYIDRPEREKETLMIGAIFKMVAAPLVKHFDPQGYGAAQPLLEELVVASTLREKGEHHKSSLNLSQVELTSLVGNIELGIIRYTACRMSAEEKADFQRQLSDVFVPQDIDDYSQLGISSLRLQKYYQEKCTQLKELLDEPDRPGSNPYRRGPSGP